ncbi:AlpA family transcriptional regulator [Novosphingobium sp. Gsoil 351]|uniref:helix-turn-helix transcriptional regulator n=1 Tax=Novosphingobium sp. Gsoil 351 TaxID=2675225 RepID=UPI0012B4962D|nr:AlpA family transcriptional regulator [Novosphingobium sp. Gsoil 351]QGN53471.1 AlpA family phage regulatory protein [Novosphingobium sp. Gsoil 351]
MTHSLLRLPAVINRTGLSRSRIYSLLGMGRFPAPVKLGGRVVAWPDNEISEWISQRIAERDASEMSDG